MMLAALCHAQEHHRIVISIPDRKLTLFEGDREVKAYDIAVGKPSTPSPEGRFEVVNRLNHPAWYSHGKVVGPGKANPLGTRWLGLSKKGYGIHGTNEPESIGKAVSHGCIRMRNEDVEELFELVETGAQVELTGTETKESTTNAVY
jgi:lipoprotein-anchoring transpeptidase ErfK/SrfK